MDHVKILDIRNAILNLVENYSNINFKEKDFIPEVSEVPVSGKVIGSLEIQNLVEASLDGWLTTGRFNDKFEEKLSSFLGVKCLLTVNSGSSANLIAFSTLTSPKLKERAIKKGDEIISVAAGFPTTVAPAGTSLVTTAPIPTVAPRPIIRGLPGLPCRIIAPAPM
jgi:CDP-6-deoxy-D-xylo-4-hexulose-3-dehydrase